MVARKYKLISIILLTSCAIAEAPKNIYINNYLSECVKVTKKHIKIISGVTLLNLEYNTISTTADCGCMSAVNNFNSYSDENDLRIHLMSGKFTFMGLNEVWLPIAAQEKLIPDTSKVLVEISCAQPN